MLSSSVHSTEQCTRSDDRDSTRLPKDVNDLFEQAYKELTKIDTVSSHDRATLCNDMAQHIPTTVEYTFTLLNSDTHLMSLTYAPNQVGSPAFLRECKRRLSMLTGHPEEMIDVTNTGGRLYTVALLEAFPLVALGDVCDIQSGARIFSSSIPGDIPVYGGRATPLSFTTTEPNRTGQSLVIPRAGVTSHCVRLMTSPFFLTDGAFTLHTKNEDTLLSEYLNSVMLTMQEDVFNLAESSIAVKSFLTVKKLQALRIPLPALQIQHQIVSALKKIDADVQAIKERINGEEQRIGHLQQLKKDVIFSLCEVPSFA